MLNLVRKETAMNIGGLIDGVNKLGALRQERKVIAHEILKLKRQIMEDYLKIGEHLLKVRNDLRANYAKGDWNGEWWGWLETIDMTHQWAGQAIRVFEKYGGEQRRCLPLHFTIAVAVELASPQADPKAVKEVEARLTKGEKVTRDEAREAVKSKKKRKKKSTQTDILVVQPGVNDWIEPFKSALMALITALKAHPTARQNLKDWLIMNL